MAEHGKKYREAKKQAPTGPVSLEEAISFLKAHPVAKFDETFELSVRLGLDPSKTEQSIRGTVSLPHGTGRKVRVLVFAAGPAAEAARQAGADHVGLGELVAKVEGGWTDFDVAIATTEAMKDVRKLGRVLGPRGLMPNPKTGTVTDDTAKAIKELKAGRVEFRMDKNGNVNVPFGKRSFEVEKLAENAKTVLAAIRAEKPAGTKGVFLRSCTVSTTMGVGLRVAVGD